jgi:hypothetical protein
MGGRGSGREEGMEVTTKKFEGKFEGAKGKNKQ